MTRPRLRFAPSPTGSLHVGNARTALFNWLQARRSDGTLLLRIEDTDRERSTPEHETTIIDDLRWLDLIWDEGLGAGGEHGPYRQSERQALYAAAADTLLSGGFAYPCFCSLELLERERAAQRDAGHVSLYSGRCRALPREQAAARREAGEPYAVRLDVHKASAGSGEIEFHDEVHGDIRFPVAQIGDFVLLRQDSTPAYNFAVVVDDIAMGITVVIRGDDHLSNTPRQVLLYRALGAVPPLFAHLPLLVAPGGAPLSKREGAVSVGSLKESGYPPEALVNHLALLGWSPPGGADFLTREEIVAGFDLKRVSRSPAVFDRAKLDALSMRHIARMPPERLAPYAEEHLTRAGLWPVPPPPGGRPFIERLAALFSERLAKFSDLPAESRVLFEFSPEKCLADPEVAKVLAEPGSRKVVEEALARLPEGSLTAPLFQAMAADVRRATGCKGRDLFHPIRVGLTGYESGPELVRLLPVIDEGSGLNLPKPILSCAVRARALLDATRPGVA